MLNKTSPILSQEFIQTVPEVQYTLPVWYQQLRQAAKEFVWNGGELSLARPPTGGYKWLLQQQLNFHGINLREEDWEAIGDTEEALEGLEPSRG